LIASLPPAHSSQETTRKVRVGGDINFDSPHEHDVFDLNIEASNHQQDGDINFDGHMTMVYLNST
jgi:hypothetical protein